MSTAILQVVQKGLGASVQDLGRVGWRKFGIPPSGVMDSHASIWANRLLENPPGAPVLELVLQGVRLMVLRETWLAITGADASSNVPMWRAVRVRPGEIIEFPRSRAGVWTYMAVEGGFAGPEILGSHSTYARGAIGRTLEPGDTLERAPGRGFAPAEGVAGRLVPLLERRDYARPPALRVWPAPQTPLFSPAAWATLFVGDWTVSSQSDRVGYRLAGARLPSPATQLLSEAVRVGTIQVPADGGPIVTMRDGPTVGGYPKLGVLEVADLPWLAQSRPGQPVRFVPAEA